RFSRDWSSDVCSSDLDVIVAQIAGPHGLGGCAATQPDAHQNFCLLHHPLPVFLAVLRVPPTCADHVHVTQVQLDACRIEIGDTEIGRASCRARVQTAV